MIPDAHVRKADRIIRSLTRCRDDDYEMVVEGAMLAANHYANAALHVLRIRGHDSDIIHTDYMTVAQYRRLEILCGDLLAGLEAIEDLRAPFVRGCASGGIEAARSARRHLEAVIAEFGRLKAPDLAMVDYLPVTTR